MLCILHVFVIVEPTKPDVGVLDHMTVTNMSDQEALDDFLNSSGDDISTGSSLTSGNTNLLILQPQEVQDIQKLLRYCTLSRF